MSDPATNDRPRTEKRQRKARRNYSAELADLQRRVATALELLVSVPIEAGTGADVVQSVAVKLLRGE